MDSKETLIIQDEVIPAYAYRNRDDISRVILTDQVIRVEQGAFFHCSNLKFIQIGENVRSIGADAFLQIHPFADILWFTALPVHSPVMRRLPEWGDLRSVCAPSRPFSSVASHEEKLTLALGFLFHPEMEERYEERNRAKICEYLQGIAQSGADLYRRQCVHEVIFQLWERKLLKNDVHPVRETFHQLLVYAKSVQTTKEQKAELDRIAEAYGITYRGNEQKQSVERDEEAALLRKILSDTTWQKQTRVLHAIQGMEMPELVYADGKTATPEILRYLLCRYGIQEGHRTCALDTEADEIARRLDEQRLSDGISALMHSIDLLHESSLAFAVARYGTSEAIRKMISLQVVQGEYDTAVYQAKSQIRRAIYLSPHPEAALFAARQNELSLYADIHHLNEEELFFKMLGDAVKKAESSEQGSSDGASENLAFLLEQYARRLYHEYLTGKRISGFAFWHSRQHTEQIRAITASVIWTNDEGNTFYLSEDGPRSVQGKPCGISRDSSLRIAHPCEMTEYDVFLWRELVNRQKMNTSFCQFPDFEKPGGNWRSRYMGLRVSHARLMGLSSTGFTEDAVHEVVRLYFQGKRILTAEKEEEDVYRIGGLETAECTVRETWEIVRLLDEAFCYEMLMDARCSIRPYMNRLSGTQREEVLRASLARGHHENVAILLGGQSELQDELAWDS